MNITVNGEAMALSDETTVRGLLEELGLGDTLVAVERNRAIVPRAEHTTTSLNDNDIVEVVHFVGGG